MTKGVELIAIERDEQINKHHFDVRHDEDYGKGELMFAGLATMYLAMKDRDYENNVFWTMRAGNQWPWRSEFGKNHLNKIEKKDLVQKLTVAGALIAAEIDRLLTLEEKGEGQ